MTLKLSNYEVYNHDCYGCKCIAVKCTSEADYGVIISFSPEKIEQMIKFLYDGVWDDKPTKN